MLQIIGGSVTALAHDVLKSVLKDVKEHQGTTSELPG